MGVTVWFRAVRMGLPGRLRRPKGIAESTRWLFAALALSSLLISVPAPLSSARGDVLLLALAATLTLTASCVWVYLSRRVPLGLDLLDTAAITVFALACANPLPVLGYAFSAIWFRGLYGSSWRSLARCGLYVAGIASSLALWMLIPGHTETPAATPIIGTFPIMFLTVIVARQLGTGLLAREQCLRRDAALAEAGSQLLGQTETSAILATAWSALTEICAATPGLRLLKAVRDEAVLRVGGATGGFGTVPATLPNGVITTHQHAGEVHILDKAPLDAAVGAPLEWVCINLPAQGDAWLLVGAPKRIDSEAVLTVHSLINQVSLALRNGDVHQELTVQARVDSLTGLANRAAFTTELSAHLAHRAEDAALHVLFLDLDDFKDVNDILGHSAGDALLIEVALRLRSCTRPQDLCARLGGDEFAVVLRGATDPAAAEIAQRMVECIAAPVHLSGRTARVGASIGIAIATPGIDIEKLVHQADVAMYAAKAHGKGRVELFNPRLLRADASRLSFERQLAGATAAGELVLHYQPVLSLPDLRCTAVEALVRWQHPEHGLLQPDDFIDAAERSGAIIDIGAFVLHRACSDAATWQQAHPETPLAVHINISARQLDHDGFIDTVKHCLSESGIPANQLVLELTETVVLNSPAAIDRLKTLAARGIQIAIDDFGTGYSSLSTLRSLPVNVIKLDKTFIAGALASPIDRTVITAIVQMSTKLGLHTIAEGVERPEQQQFLEEIGTDAVQGYLYQRPVPAPQLTAWLQDNLNTRTPTANTLVPLRSTKSTRVDQVSLALLR